MATNKKIAWKRVNEVTKGGFVEGMRLRYMEIYFSPFLNINEICKL